MNPPGTLPPPRLHPLLNLLMLGALIVCVALFLYTHVQNSRVETLITTSSAALAKKDTSRAKDLLDTYLRAHPTDASVYLAFSELCMQFNELPLALEYAQRGLESCKNASNADRAQLYVQLSQVQSLAEPAHPQTKAIASARSALSLDPDDPALKNAVGYMLADNDQNLDEAEKLLREALQLLKPAGEDLRSDSLRPSVEDSFGWLLYKKGDYAGAVAALNQASHDMPSGMPGLMAKYFYYHLGAAYRKAGRIEEARSALAVALQYDPTFPEAKAEDALLPPPHTPAAPSIPAAPVSAPVNPAPPASSTPAPGLKL